MVATIDALLSAAELREPRRSGSLVERLTSRLGAVGARDGGKAIGPAALRSIEQDRGLSDDTGRRRPGSLFVAIEGEHVDGHDLLEAAVGGVVAAPSSSVRAPSTRCRSSSSPRTRRARPAAASWWYGDPSR